ncbi:MAG: type II toxin-antitoxin system RelE/ParE family toxin [Alphaproteobacteria bacterium]|nr:MAG: type II toxin-antitoxin system RelE/ParE family toxin [Alphaproteobacteria bacterium]
MPMPCWREFTGPWKCLHPKIGRERHEFSGTPRSFIVRPYVVFYEPLADDNGILVWRILHGARDLRRLIHPPDR